jgi:hypothetical protein
MRHQIQQKRSASEALTLTETTLTNHASTPVPVTFTSGLVSEGIDLDLTLPGFLIKSSVAAEDAQSLQLELFCRGSGFGLGHLRLSDGRKEALQWSSSRCIQSQRILQRFVAQHCMMADK